MKSPMVRTTEAERYEYRNSSVWEISHEDLGPMFSICTSLSEDGQTLGVEIIDHANEEMIYVNDFDRE